jgi:hypothetical protein
METSKRYREYQEGDPITAGKVWNSTVEVSKKGWGASRAASRRHITIVAVDTTARVLAWQSAKRATKSSAWKIVHVVSKRVAGNAGRIFMVAEVFGATSNDVRRYREGELLETDFYRNLALTGIAIAAPALGAPLGPVGATAGLTIAVTAGMLRK